MEGLVHRLVEVVAEAVSFEFPQGSDVENWVYAESLVSGFCEGRDLDNCGPVDLSYFVDEIMGDC